MEHRLSPLASAADQLLRERGSSLEQWLASAKAEGIGLRVIAARLTEELGWTHRPISHQTVANWLAELAGDEVSA